MSYNRMRAGGGGVVAGVLMHAERSVFDLAYVAAVFLCIAPTCGVVCWLPPGELLARLTFAFCIWGTDTYLCDFCSSTGHAHSSWVHAWILGLAGCQVPVPIVRTFCGNILPPRIPLASDLPGERLPLLLSTNASACCSRGEPWQLCTWSIIWGLVCGPLVHNYMRTQLFDALYLVYIVRHVIYASSLDTAPMLLVPPPLRCVGVPRVFLPLSLIWAKARPALPLTTAHYGCSLGP